VGGCVSTSVSGAQGNPDAYTMHEKVNRGSRNGGKQKGLGSLLREQLQTLQETMQGRVGGPIQGAATCAAECTLYSYSQVK
jgi:hypothetical protein